MTNPQQELAEIKSMMQRSSKFLSLSGSSGIWIGLLACIATALAYYWIYYPNAPWETVTMEQLHPSIVLHMILLAFAVAIISLFFAYRLTKKRSKVSSENLWSPSSRRFLSALFFPMAIGGFMCLGRLWTQDYESLASLMLIFYGLGLVNASYFTLGEIKYLGFAQIILGLLAMIFPSFGLILWALGFGICHIFYGGLIHYKYDR
ncbi:hypothetical protein ACFOSV_16905 [Algoriphagus namhaensis]|uniref:Uncharacterized protein n=1 Tax=Algoriphagus namhaensis TaxID=915353 RepID=A0ABV8AV94_9BACT